MVMHNGTYTTSNTALAAYLVSEGFNYDIDDDKFPVLFNFEDSESLQKSRRNWDIINAPVNAPIYYDNYRKLLRLIKAGKDIPARNTTPSAT